MWPAHCTYVASTCWGSVQLFSTTQDFTYLSSLRLLLLVPIYLRHSKYARRGWRKGNSLGSEALADSNFSPGIDSNHSKIRSIVQTPRSPKEYWPLAVSPLSEVLDLLTLRCLHLFKSWRYWEYLHFICVSLNRIRGRFRSLRKYLIPWIWCSLGGWQIFPSSSF